MGRRRMDAHLGAALVGGQGVIANEAPDEEALDACEKAGEALAKAAK